MIGDGINAGDLALIQKEPDFVQGKIYAVIVDLEKATLKRVTRTNDSVILSPSNPKYEPRIITGLELEMFQIIGRSINIKRNYY
ncbi:LexA family protein [Carnobacterium alterfunditum]|uniref:LexA family protein n=1 Tax=Carnobacterium alterfunditum TaxID=28230 RepID=UPI003593FC00